MSRKTVLITGAGSGIGRALAHEADQRGHRLILVGRRLDALTMTRHGLAATDAICVQADVTTPEGRHAIRAAVPERLDILINNAGVLEVGPVGTLEDAALERMLATNVAAPMALTRDLLPLLAPAGQVVNVGSVFGDIAYPYFAAYSATKFALRGFSDALRREVGGQGIAVTYLAPRATRTEAAHRFARLVAPMDMAMDTPEAVARHAWFAIAARRREQYPPTRERVFVLLQRLAPSLIDKALSTLAGDPLVVKAAQTDIRT